MPNSPQSPPSPTLSDRRCDDSHSKLVSHPSKRPRHHKKRPAKLKTLPEPCKTCGREEDTRWTSPGPGGSPLCNSCTPSWRSAELRGVRKSTWATQRTARKTAGGPTTSRPCDGTSTSAQANQDEEAAASCPANEKEDPQAVEVSPIDEIILKPDVDGTAREAAHASSVVSATVSAARDTVPRSNHLNLYPYPCESAVWHAGWTATMRLLAHVVIQLNGKALKQLHQDLMQHLERLRGLPCSCASALELPRLKLEAVLEFLPPIMAMPVPNPQLTNTFISQTLQASETIETALHNPQG